MPRQDLPEEFPRPLVPGIAEELLRFPLLDDGAAGHEDHPVGDLAREAHLMGDADHRHAVLGETDHRVEHLPDHLRVEG
jgi:hypothetical protein